MRTRDRFGKRGFFAVFLLTGIALALTGCAAITSATSLPHNGSLSSLSQWWQQQNDALLVDMISAAQIVSPSVITARSNIQQAQTSSPPSSTVQHLRIRTSPMESIA